MVKGRKKYGLFLSVELTVVLVIVIAIVATIMVSSRVLMGLYQANGIVREVKQISEAIIYFKQIYDYWPGDIPSSKISGQLNIGKVKSSIQTAENFSLSSVSNTLDLLKLKSHNNMATGLVSGYKSALATQQLLAAELIPARFLPQAEGTLTSVGNVTLGTGPMSTMANQFKSNVIRGLYYLFTMDACNKDNKRSACSRPGAPIYDLNYGVYPTLWSGIPMIMTATSNSSLYAIVDASSNNVGSLLFGAASQQALLHPSTAAAIDSKIDDGAPTGNNSSVVSMDSFPAPSNYATKNSCVYQANGCQISSAGTFIASSTGGYYGCTDLLSLNFGVSSKTIPNLTANFASSKYLSHNLSSTGSPSTLNCNMIFAIR